MGLLDAGRGSHAESERDDTLLGRYRLGDCDGCEYLRGLLQDRSSPWRGCMGHDASGAAGCFVGVRVVMRWQSDCRPDRQQQAENSDLSRERTHI